MCLVVKEDTQEPVPDLLTKTDWFLVEVMGRLFSVLNSAQGSLVVLMTCSKTGMQRRWLILSSFLSCEILHQQFQISCT